MRFKELAIGDEFDFISPDGMTNSFFSRCKKVSTRVYCDDIGFRYLIGYLKCEVYNVVINQKNQQGETTMIIEFIEKDQVYQEETTNYWFSVDGESYAISDCNGELSLLDSDGCPGDNPRIFDALKPEYEKRIMDI